MTLFRESRTWKRAKARWWLDGWARAARADADLDKVTPRLEAAAMRLRGVVSSR